MPLKIGDTAPPFDLPTEHGRVSRAALEGRPFVLYFYPRDNTPGCTLEALDFTSRIKAFEALGARIVAVSKDSVQSHCGFARKHKLQILLASDETLEAAQAYGVWVEKTLYGKKSMGMERATFLIDAGGTIRAIWRKVKVAGHAEAVLAELGKIA